MTAPDVEVVEIRWTCFGCGALNQPEVALGAETATCYQCGHVTEEWEVLDDEPTAASPALLALVTHVHDAPVEVTRGEGGEIDTDGTLVLDTVQGVQVWVRPEVGGWRATIHIPQQGFSAPLEHGPSLGADTDSVVSWIRRVCDASPDSE